MLTSSLRFVVGYFCRFRTERFLAPAAYYSASHCFCPEGEREGEAGGGGGRGGQACPPLFGRVLFLSAVFVRTQENMREGVNFSVHFFVAFLHRTYSISKRNAINIGYRKS